MKFRVHPAAQAGEPRLKYLLLVKSTHTTKKSTRIQHVNAHAHFHVRAHAEMHVCADRQCWRRWIPLCRGRSVRCTAVCSGSSGTSGGGTTGTGYWDVQEGWERNHKKGEKEAEETHQTQPGEIYQGEAQVDAAGVCV